MSNEESHKIDYVVLIINEYAKSKGISVKDAFFQLLGCGGIDALDELYDIEHTLPISSTVDGLADLYARSTS